MNFLANINKPAPRWFRITKKMVNMVTNLTITVLMIVGHRADDIILLIIKVVQSFVMDTLDTFMSNGEVYAQQDTLTKQVTLTETTVDTTLPYSAPNDKTV